MPSIKLRTWMRTPISIGSNQSSKSWVLAKAAECSATDFVLLLPMAWSPPACQRRNRLGWTTRRLRHFQFLPTPGRHQHGRIKDGRRAVAEGSKYWLGLSEEKGSTYDRSDGSMCHR